MPTFRSFAQFGSALDASARDLTGPEKRKITRAQGEIAQKIATRAASGDLGGDPKFSGWAPKLETQLKSTSSGATILHPTRTSAGPWTVAQQGRNKGNAGGFAGPGVNRKTGATARTKSGKVRKVRVSGARRWNGYTSGKNTADKARAAMESELPKIATDGVRSALRKRLDVS